MQSDRIGPAVSLPRFYASPNSKARLKNCSEGIALSRLLFTIRRQVGRSEFEHSDSRDERFDLTIILETQ